MDRDARLKRIWETIRDIPSGRVASYGQVAEIAGIPRGARQTAYALRVAPDDLELPWFRVITASGKLAFKPGTAAFRRQRDLLRDDGVTVTAGKVDMDEFRWQPDLDELLWKPTSAWDEP
ncbi:MAG: MGMT family protein [Woeseiaceae bacterium]|nr:MGMT family protein [Woeseiaceae bacterium]